jgi:SAM-dependent methyltransferase
MMDRLRLTKAFVASYSRFKYLRNTELREKNRELMTRGSRDLPYPPPHLVFLVTGEFDIQKWEEKGILGAQCIRAILSRNGFDIGSFRSVLDFGCGCGRVMRQWAELRGPELHGTDYNPALVDWCSRSLPFAKFRTNPLEGPLSYADASFDFIYAISVFTHWSEPLQRSWIRELARISKPGGVLYMTTHGRSYLPDLDAHQRKRFEAGELVVVRDHDSGSNLCAAYHPECYVREKLARSFEVLDFQENGALDAKQDVFLLRKLKSVSGPLGPSPSYPT